MNKTTQLDDRQWLLYIETLRRQSRPVKVDTLLQQRIQSFTAARKHLLEQAKK